ncbi:MAG: response regulator transcription factor [Cyanobacteria bacterium SZAS-4]|nr:response regulator transcription factor [Cyanobacteria bacterium SZAS-4]
MARILVVEDELELSKIMAEWLEDEFHVVNVAHTGSEAQAKLATSVFELIILDLMLPEVNGIEICRSYRESGGATPILMVTAKKSLSSKENGLDSGADDYLTKPFKLRELSARVRALLRRPKAVVPTVLSAGSIELDLNARTVTRGGQEVRLVGKEFALLELLMRNAGKVITVDTIIDNLWSESSNISNDTVRSHIRSLRQKLDGDSDTKSIVTLHGIGYRIDER